MTTEVEKGVNDMCNLGEGIYENGIAEGTVKGRIEGREEGVISTLLDLVKDGSISIELAAKKANKSVEEIEDLMREKSKI
jgi:predicted transposase YdaD